MDDPAAEPLNRQIGRRLRAARVLRGLSQKQLGEMVGVAFQQVQKYENGKNAISPARMHRLAENLKVTIQYFYGAAEIGVPDVEPSSDRLLRLWTGLRRLEQRHPNQFILLCKYIDGLVAAKKN